MSEIYSPGSIAGPQGPAGPAGSLGSVTALASSVLPVLGNLFDPNKVVDNYSVQADGTLAANNGWASSGLIYCPGMTSMAMNLPMDAGDAAFAAYDANGNFVSVIPSSSLGSAWEGGPAVLTGGAAFPLPGTQVYVRFSWSTGKLGGYGSVLSVSQGMVYASTGAAALPGNFTPFGFDTPGDVNAKDAVVAAVAQAALAASLTGSVEMAVNTLLPSPVGGGRNVFDATKALQNFSLGTNGSVSAAAAWGTVYVYAPNATEFITNVPIRGVPNGVGVCLYDALGNFLEDISTTTLASDFTTGNCLTPNVIYSLPGTQTYVRFSYLPSQTAMNAMFFAGTAASPCPSSLPAGQPFAGSFPVSAKTASQLGCATDGSADSTALVNSFLATASNTNPVKLILDGLIATTGLVLSTAGYTTIEGIGRGSGIAVIPGSNQDAIRIGAYTASTGASDGAYNIAPPAQSASNIALRNFTVNMNNNTTNGASTTPANEPVAGAPAHTVFGTIFANCTDVVVENMNYINAPWFNLCFSNASNIRVSGCEFTSTGYGKDGIHIDGLCSDIAISDCAFATGDDAIALNAPEGYGGDISRVTVTNCRFNGSLTVMRIYTSLDAAAMPSNNVHRVRNVVVSNCTGSVTSVCFNLGITNGGLSATSDVDQIQDLRVTNCTFSAPQGLALLLTPIGSAVFKGVGFTPAGTNPVVQVLFSSVGEIVLDDVTILRNPVGNAVPGGFVSLYSGVAVDRVSLLNCRVVDEEGSSYTAVPYAVDNNGTIAALRLEAIDLTHVAALFSSAGTGGIALLRGGGVLGTGALIPDSIMDNNALYLSSNASGAPSIKVGGTAKRLTLA